MAAFCKPMSTTLEPVEDKVAAMGKNVKRVDERLTGVTSELQEIKRLLQKLHPEPRPDRSSDLKDLPPLQNQNQTA